MTDVINATNDFIKEKFLIGTSEDRFVYRYEHTLRTAAIGQKIARGEGLNEEALMIACLLHDIGYVECVTHEDYDTHGRLSSRIAREYLESIHYDSEWIDTITYGILAHTEEQPERKLTPFEISIADADNIDRFDAYRLYEFLRFSDLEKKTSNQMLELAQKRYHRLVELRDYPNGSKTADQMWKDKIDFQIGYYDRLIAQMSLDMF